MNISRYLQVKVQCQSCGHDWPQVLNRHLDDIECPHCSERGVNVIHVNEKDIEQWQADISNVEHTYNEINAEVMQKLQEIEVS